MCFWRRLCKSVWLGQGCVQTSRTVLAYPVAERSPQQIDMLCAMPQKCLMWLFRLQVLSPRGHLLLCPNLLGTLKAFLILWLLPKHPWHATGGICCFCPFGCWVYFINVYSSFLPDFLLPPLFHKPVVLGLLWVISHQKVAHNITANKNE